MRDDPERLRDILSAADRIFAKTTKGKDTFLTDEMLQVWVLHHLQIIGEACRSLSDAFRERHPADTWRAAAGLRHILVHHYFQIDADAIWAVVESDLHPLRELVRSILEEELGAV